ncbi:zinc finger C2HC domain-containing protein 1A-like [Parasteatoda tepidariorum]|uniref:zinc finger C2HC domain-containing protein 1A-like n=1 Tax=Parasteatoda tepidariorum TaxID=114398 RepID=UPI001C71BE6C|nr:zinc finger C2HC domain-containing protein 1A-like [Parasteatoda tepidariorum]
MEHPEPSDESPSELRPCGICGRTFRPDALVRHQKVCEKNAAKKRKVFDSSKQRALEDAPPPAPKAAAKPTKQVAAKAKAAEAKTNQKKNTWREKHEELIDTIKKARGKPEDNPPPGKENRKKVPSDYVQCPSCQRHFNQRAAERHIPWCKEKKALTPKSAETTDEAKQKLIARVKYRPPQGKSRVLNRKTKTAESNHISNTKQKTPPEREKQPRSSPPVLDNRRSRNSSLDRANNNVAYSNVKHRSGSRSREKEQLLSPELPQHIIKFKERFPNHNNKRNVDLEESFTSEQLRELLSCSRITDRIPRTVPGVRLTGGHQYEKNHNDNWNSRSTDVSRSASSSGGSSNSWNKRPTLPEVSSSELPGTWMGKMCWNGDLDQSMNSNGSSSGSSNGSLPPLSRESNDDTPLNFYCHQCNSKFPLIGAKYCCECGAKRRGLCINQTG